MSLNQIVFFDIEQTCWDTTPPEGSTIDIIQIGFCEVDNHTLEITRKSNFYVKTNSEISDYCTSLTGITSKKLKNASTFETVMKKISNLYSKKKTWMSWGQDYNDIILECEKHNVEPFISNNCVDFGHLYSISNGLYKQPSLLKSLEKNNLEFIGNQHHALDDAINTARLYIEFTKKMRSLNE